MAIDRDWQIELVGRDLVIGAGTVFDVLTPPGPTGLLGSAAVRSNDLDRQGDGSSAGGDRYTSRLITVPVAVNGQSSVVDAHERTRALVGKWRRSVEDDVELAVRTPGQAETVLSYYGRPRGVTESGSFTLRSGHVAVLLAFTATDPFAYGELVELEAETVSPLTVPAAGDLGTTTYRAVLTVVSAGGRPIITNTTTGGTIAFVENAVGTFELDLESQIITDGLDVNRDALGAASSDWFGIAGGVDNLLSFTGATSIAVALRPSYEVL